MKFLYQKYWSLDVPLCRLLCNALIQPHFDYACIAWYPNLSKKLKDKLQVARNKCIRFCLKLQSREHISNEHFHKLDWLPINQMLQQCVTPTVFKFDQKKCPTYTNEVFRLAENIRINTRNSFIKLNHLFQKKPVPDKKVCLILDLLFGTEFQKFLRKPEIWILSSIKCYTTIWMISLILIYEILVDLIMLWLISYRIFFFSLNKYFYILLFSFSCFTFSLILLLTSAFFICG